MSGSISCRPTAPRSPAKPRRWRRSPICSAADQRARSIDTLVVEEQVAVGAGAYYMGSAVDDTRLWVYATPAPDVSLQDLDVAIDRVLRRFAEEPIDAEHLQRAKTRLIADAIYAQDSQASLARWYGEALATGLPSTTSSPGPSAWRR